MLESPPQHPSLRLRWVTSTAGGRVSASTAKLWLCALISTRPLTICLNRLGCRYDDQILADRCERPAPARGSDGRDRCRGWEGATRQVHAPRPPHSRRRPDRPDRCLSRTPSGRRFKTSAAVVDAGTTRTRQPSVTRRRKMLRLDTKIVHDHQRATLRSRGRDYPRGVACFVPIVGLPTGHLLRQVDAIEPGKCFRPSKTRSASDSAASLDSTPFSIPPSRRRRVRARVSTSSIAGTSRAASHSASDPLPRASSIRVCSVDAPPDRWRKHRGFHRQPRSRPCCRSWGRSSRRSGPHNSGRSKIS